MVDKKKRIALIEPVVGNEEIKEVCKVLRSGWLTEGPETRKFEDAVRKYVGVKHAFATTSCTTAMELALRALGVDHGDEVIVPDFTHPSTGNVVSWIGATPVLVDVDISSYNIVPSEVEKAITKKTRCIIPVSWGGNPLDMKPLLELKEKHDLFIIEDAACSIGSEYKGVKTGITADITCFSFHPRKIVTTGEGGMAITNDNALADQLAKLKKFGMETKSGKIRFMSKGTNHKLSDVLGAIGVAQMHKVERLIDRRIELANYYTRLLGDEERVRPPQKEKDVKHTYQTYAVYIKKEHLRDKIIADLRKHNIETQIGTYALHLEPSYKQVKKVGKLTTAEKLYRNLLALPMQHSMTKQDQERVMTELRKSLSRQ